MMEKHRNHYRLLLQFLFFLVTHQAAIDTFRNLYSFTKFILSHLLPWYHPDKHLNKYKLFIRKHYNLFSYLSLQHLSFNTSHIRFENDNISYNVFTRKPVLDCPEPFLTPPKNWLSWTRYHLSSRHSSPSSSPSERRDPLPNLPVNTIHPYSPQPSTSVEQDIPPLSPPQPSTSFRQDNLPVNTPSTPVQEDHDSSQFNTSIPFAAIEPFSPQTSTSISSTLPRLPSPPPYYFRKRKQINYNPKRKYVRVI